MPRTLAVFVFSLCLAPTAGAEVYTWIDRNGVAHFSDFPPGKIPHQQVAIQPPVTMPMQENLRQQKRVSDIRDDIEGMLSATDVPGREHNRNQAREKAADEQEAACQEYRRKLDRIQSKLRAGYGNDKGNTLRRQRRDVSQSLSRECILR